jgi:hypothetical protein
LVPFFLNEHLLFSFLWVEVLWCLLGWTFSFKFFFG